MSSKNIEIDNLSQAATPAPPSNLSAPLNLDDALHLLPQEETNEQGKNKPTMPPTGRPRGGRAFFTEEQRKQAKAFKRMRLARLVSQYRVIGEIRALTDEEVPYHHIRTIEIAAETTTDLPVKVINETLPKLVKWTEAALKEDQEIRQQLNKPSELAHNTTAKKTASITAALYRIYAHDPYPTPATIQRLAIQLNKKPATIYAWFRRTRHIENMNDGAASVIDSDKKLLYQLAMKELTEALGYSPNEGENKAHHELIKEAAAALKANKQ